MAKLIRPTPILEGEDKTLFLESLNVKYDPQKEKFLKECYDLAKKVKLEF